MRTTFAAVHQVKDASPTVKIISLAPEEKISFKAGQWIYIFADKGGEKIKRAYSVASHPDEPELRLCVKRVENGFMSNFLCDMTPGRRLEISQPFGTFILDEPGKDIIFIATGTGIAPFMSMLPELAMRRYGGHVTVIFGARTRDEVLYEKEINKMTASINLSFVPVLSREEWAGEKGHVQDAVKKYAKPGGEAYICGLVQMVTEVRQLLEGMGLDRKRIHFENYI
ncbi:MAG: hypothetical protein J4431_00525 [Candidatus Aenigmarchaeota archaeon]|nr:hypothetical protein [Candidatus Aenigmarchaeota archaeon]